MDFTIEELTMNAWPSLQTILMEGWIIRISGGYTKKANSVNPIYSFENNLDQKINYCENIFKQNSLPIIYRIIECEDHKKIDKRLEELKYQKIYLSSVQICNEIKRINCKTEQITVDKVLTESWKNCFYYCNNIINMETINIIDNMLNNIRQNVISVYIMDNETFAGCGYGVIEKGFVGLFDIVVKEEFRGKGYGKAIVETILDKAEETGIKMAYLSVANDNIVAKGLYEKLGFREIYKYWYRKKD